MANDLMHQPDKEKKHEAVKPKPVQKPRVGPGSWFQSNAQEFIDWATRVTESFSKVNAALFESVRAAYASLGSSDKALVDEAVHGKTDLGMLLRASDLGSFDRDRAARAEHG